MLKPHQDTGNKISRRCQIEGKQNIMLGGKTVIMPACQLRGDLQRHPGDYPKDKGPTTAISIGRCTVVCTNTTLRPALRSYKYQPSYVPMRIGDNVFIGPGCVISAASISSHVYIGERCVLQAMCIIKESVKILPGTVVPSGMTVPAGSLVGGRPGRILEEVPDGFGQGGTAEYGEWVEGGDLRGLVRSIK